MLSMGIAIGVIAGGEIMRSLYAPRPLVPVDLDSVVVRQPSSVPISEGEAITASRHNAIVRATQVVSPCVVGIVVTQIQVVQNRYQYNDFFDFFVPKVRQVENLGSGVVIREDGMILTNYHVVRGARTLYVNFPDGCRMHAKVVGVDPQTDLAVISVDAENLQCVKMGDSDELVIGEWAIAIGNPFLNFINDAHPTVTVGVVSALGRNFRSPDGAHYRGMIQTDAAINPGNSGGPLVDALGRAIGINTVIYTLNESKTYIGMGFAIPINRARRVAEELIEHGRRRQFWTGIAAQDLTREIALALGYESTEGVVVTAVQEGSPGAKAGLKRGDVLVSIGDTRIHASSDIEAAFVDLFVNDRAKVTYRRGGKVDTTYMHLEEHPGIR